MSGTGIHVSPDMDPKEALAHYGVKGMQWGKTKAPSGPGFNPAAARKPTKQEIGDARLNVAQGQLKLAQAKRATKNFDKGSVERALADKKYGEMKTDFLKNPDRVTASYLTKGEKTVMGILAVATAPAGGIGYVGGAAAGRAIARKRIASKQRSGAYDK